MRKVEVVDYRDSWAEAFRLEDRVLHKALGDLNPAIHHIGSTSVQGLSAKPVIDILIEVEHLDSLEAQTDALAAIGYRYRGENGIPGRLYYEKGGEDRTHQVHAFETGSRGAIRHLAFRDYLRAHPDVAHDYAELKKQVARNCNNDIEVYCDGKDEFVQQHEKLALEWYSKNSGQPSDATKPDR